MVPEVRCNHIFRICYILISSFDKALQFCAQKYREFYEKDDVLHYYDMIKACQSNLYTYLYETGKLNNST